MNTDATLTVIAALLGFVLVVLLRREERPRRLLTRNLGDATERRRALRLIQGGGGR